MARIGGNWLRDDGYVSHQGTPVRVITYSEADETFKPRPVGFTAHLRNPQTPTEGPETAVEAPAPPAWDPDTGDYA